MQMFTENTSSRGSTSRGFLLFSLIAMVMGIFWGMMRDLFTRRVEPDEPNRGSRRVAAELGERTV